MADATYKAGDLVIAVADGERGVVVSVDNAGRTFIVQWTNDGVAYPLETLAVRRPLPWET